MFSINQFCLLLLYFTLGTATNIYPKIYGGHTVALSKYPYMVHFYIGNNFQCGGTLISPSCVLFAAHCLRYASFGNLHVFAQKECRDDFRPEIVQHSWVQRILGSYPKNPYFLDKDVAVLKLWQPFRGIPTVQIDYQTLPVFANLTIVGWGETYNRSIDESKLCLQGVNAISLPQDVCERYHVISENMFCATGINRIDSCHGDSGGPVLYNGKQVGIVSFGYQCGLGHPGVYTRLSSPAVSGFLKTTIEQNCRD